MVHPLAPVENEIVALCIMPFENEIVAFHYKISDVIMQRCMVRRIV